MKEYIDLENTEATKLLLRGVFEIERNEKQCYLREFSIKVFHDSKMLQSMSGRLGKIFRTFGEDTEEKDFAQILAEYGIYHTPNYVYLKGKVSFWVHETLYHIADLKQGIGISGEDLSAIRFCDMGEIRRVMTIENLTTFFRWEEADALIIYLGGYHNSVRRKLLKTVYEALPAAEYYHFGDIDAGGFEIYKDLCEKTGIPFRMYRMDLNTLQIYEEYGRELTEHDRIRLQRMLEAHTFEEESMREVIRYMLERNVKLEQECVLR